MPLRLISFDAAGTLIHVREPVGETYAAFARRHGISAEPASLIEAFRRLWTTIPSPLRPEGEASPDDDRSWWHAFAARVFADALGEPVPAHLFEPMFAAIYQHYAKGEAWAVYDDVLPALEALAQDHQLCVLSNFDRRLIAILSDHGLTHYFSNIILSSEVGAAKPHPRMFVTAERLHDALPAHCLHVGDDARCDITGAQQCGWQAFAVERPQRGLADLVEKVRLSAT